jgi:type IV pilus assembly protein PilW
MLSLSRSRAGGQRGFSLVELLVGMLIALLSTLIIMQVYETFEGQKRTTTGGADAQTNGSIALYNIQRDVAMAGYGLPVLSTLNPALLCDPLPKVDHDNNPATPDAGMYPIMLTDGGNAAGASDGITVRYGSTATGGVPIAATIAANNLVVANNLACQANDIALLVNGSACEMWRVSALIGDTNITLESIPPGNATTMTSGMIACMGRWNEVSYDIANNMMTRNGGASVAGIVNIQAQYGISAAPNSNSIVRWVDPSGADWGMTADGAGVLLTPNRANRNLIKAVRVAVVARSGQWEKELVSTACSSTTTPNPTGVCAWAGTATSPAPTIDLSNDADWQHYRYRVFDVIIPLRNVVWSLNTLPSS